MSTDYSWIEKGAEVVVVRKPRTDAQLATIKRGTVEKVNPRTFRVSGQPNLFSRDDGWEQIRDAWAEKDQVWRPDDPRLAELRQNNRIVTLPAAMLSRLALVLESGVDPDAGMTPGTACTAVASSLRAVIANPDAASLRHDHDHLGDPEGAEAAVLAPDSDTARRTDS